MSKLYSIHLTTSSDPAATPMVAVVAHDDHGFVVGSREEAVALRDALDRYIKTGKYDGEIDELDERLGFRWLDIADAVDLAEQMDMPAAAQTIRTACADGRIKGAILDGKTWRFPKMRFLGWLKTAPRRRGRPKIYGEASK